MECDCPVCEAAIDAHLAVISSLQEELGRKPNITETANALAKAFGHACGILVAHGHKIESIHALNGVANDAAIRMQHSVMAASSVGPMQ